MAKKAAVLSALIALVGLVLVATVPFASAAKTRTLTFTTPQNQEVANFVDTGKKGGSLGDYVVVHGPLHQQGGVAGTFYAQCTFVSLKTSTAQCLITFKLAAGQITFQGVGVLERQGGPPVTIAVTGGTGAYQSARGQVNIRTVNKVDHFTVHLIL